MASKGRPGKKHLGFFEARDRLLHLNNAYRLQSFGGRGLDSVSRRFERELAEIETPEPDEELEDSELSDNARRAAMERERLRRERNR